MSSSYAALGWADAGAGGENRDHHPWKELLPLIAFGINPGGLDNEF